MLIHRRCPWPTMLTATFTGLLLCAASLPASAQKKLETGPAQREPMPEDLRLTWTGTTPPSEANIAAILVAADESAVKDARLAQSKASSPQVKTFAQTLASDHTVLEQQAVAVLKRLAIEPVENATSSDLATRSEKERARLERIPAGKQFDRAYLDSEVRFEKGLLEALNTLMIPNAKSTDLAQLLKSARSEVRDHVKQGKQLESSMKA